MKCLYNELLARFPEINQQLPENGVDQPYLAMGALVDWVASKDHSQDAMVVRRLVDFSKWCESQPRGETADNDLWTIYVVAFLEGLFLTDNTRCLIPRLMSWEKINAEREYLVGWIGQDNYDKAVACFLNKQQRNKAGNAKK